MSDPFERSPIAQAPLSIVLPAYNVETCLEKVLRNWTAYVDTLGRDYEILVVDDGSTDRTLEFAGTLAAQYPRFRLLQHPAPRGIGAALRTGLGAAQFPLLVYGPCSTAYQPADLGRLLEVIDKVDLVSGYRVGRPRRERPLWKAYVQRGLLRFLFGLRLKDVDCPFKLFRRSIFARIPIQSDGPFVHAEILAKANFLGCLMTEVPVRYEPNRVDDGQSGSHTAWRKDASRIFFHPDFGPALLPEQSVPPQP
jgi:glycosyltransferase involved in cell wall biosynthesis